MATVGSCSPGEGGNTWNCMSSYKSAFFPTRALGLVAVHPAKIRRGDIPPGAAREQIPSVAYPVHGLDEA